MLPITENHCGTIAARQLELIAHRDCIYWAYIRALSAKDAAVQMVFNLSFFSLPYQKYSAGRAGILAEDAAYAFFHIPEWATPEALWYGRPL